METAIKEPSKAEIKEGMREFAEIHLIDAVAWPANEEAQREFSDLCEHFKLEQTMSSKHEDPRAKQFEEDIIELVGADLSHFTDLGIECWAHLVACLIGAHRVFEIPTFLKFVGLICWCEANEFYSAEYKNEDAAVRAVRELALKAYRRSDLYIERVEEHYAGLED